MSLINALNIGRSALAAHQAAIQVTSNNVANAGNPDYTRQTARLQAAPDQYFAPGLRIGSGVNLVSIQHQIDEAFEGRIRGSISDEQAALLRQEWAGRTEAIFHELGDDDLSTQLSAFFNSWSNLANNPTDIGLRQVVVQNGQSLASTIQSQSRQLGSLRTDLDKRLSTLVDQVNGLAQQVADLNVQIVSAEGGVAGSANNLRDQRDALLKKLSELVDIRVQDTGDGNVNVLIGSEPLVLGATNRGIAFEQDSEGQTLTARIVSATDGGTLNVTSGQLGALLGLRQDIDSVGGQFDSLAANLIFELNKVHSSGQGLEGFSQVLAANAVANTGAALNSSATGLPFAPINGSFVLHVRQKATGLSTSTLVQVDLDGLNGDDTTLESLKNSIDAIDGVIASIVNGRLKIQADSADTEISFSQDSSGTLAALGINVFFKGSDATNIAVNDDLKNRPSLLAAARNGQSGDNQTARAIAELQSQSLSGLDGTSINDKYESLINGIAVAASSARTNAQAAGAIKETLLAQREAISGVSIDEEAVNLMQEQRAFQGAARVIAVVDEMMKTLLSMV